MPLPQNVSVPDVEPYVQLIGNGVATSFPFAFWVEQPTDVKVVIDDTPQVYGGDFTVSRELEPQAGGTVEFTTAPDAFTRVTIYRDMPVERLTDFGDGSELRARILNLELDRITAEIRQLERKVERHVIQHAVQIPPDSVDVILPKLVAGKRLGTDGFGITLHDPDTGPTLSVVDGGSFLDELTPIQFRRGVTADRLGVILESGKPGWDTALKRLFIGDNATAGGIPVGGIMNVDLRDFGLNGVGLVNAIAAAAALIGVDDVIASAVMVPAGVTIETAQVIDLPTRVSLVCDGIFRLRAQAALSSVLSIDHSLGDMTGNRYGVVRGVWIDGNAGAYVGLYCGLAVQRLFQFVRVTGCLDVGIAEDLTQNCAFYRCDSEGNGSVAAVPGEGVALGGGLRLNHGASNNQHNGIQLRENLNSQLVITQNDTCDDPAKGPHGTPFGPQDNSFWGGTMEVPVSTKKATVYVRAGRGNALANVSINAAGCPLGFAAVLMTHEDGLPAGPLTVRGGSVQGTVGNTTAFKAGQQCSLLVEGVRFENHRYPFAGEDNGAGGGRPIILSINNSIPFGTSVLLEYEQFGTAFKDTVMRSAIDQFVHAFVRLAGGDICWQSAVDGDTAARIRVFANGTTRYTNGAAENLGPLGVPWDVFLHALPTPGGTTFALRFAGPLELGATNVAIFPARTTTPEGSLVAKRGSIVPVDNADPDVGGLWHKNSGDNTASGWEHLGAAGAAGPGGDVSRFEETFTATDTKAVAHNLGQEFVGCDVYDSTGLRIGVDVTVVDANNLTLTFTGTTLTGATVVVFA